jgi:hypothetical protein
MALKEHFWGQKYTFKIKKPGSRANGRKVGSQIAIQKIKISPTSFVIKLPMSWISRIIILCLNPGIGEVVEFYFEG